jgi:hypothetical protein
MTSRPSTAAPIMAVLAIVLVTLGAYAWGYIQLANRVDVQWDSKPTASCRSYRYQWMATAFKPAAQIESWLTGVWVETMTYEDFPIH